MRETRFHGRRAVQIENEEIRVTVTREGGHLAEILDKRTNVNPLWIPPWPSIEPSSYDRGRHPEYGDDAESKLLAGIMGHNLCVDLFGPPSAEEAAAGVTVHGEASIATYDIEARDAELTARATLRASQLAVERTIRLEAGGVLNMVETVENLSPFDRPIAWTQHVTIGPPFLIKGETRFRAPGTRARTLEGKDFEWPYLPLPDGSRQDLQTYTDAPASGGFSTHLMDPSRERAYFLAFTPSLGVLFGYVWERSDFPWLGIWDENHSRTAPPWNGRTLTRGLEFGASPFPEPRRKMIERNRLFDAPCYRWIPAQGKATVEYAAFIRAAREIPDEPDLEW
jgi:hypothetical protein